MPVERERTLLPEVACLKIKQIPGVRDTVGKCAPEKHTRSRSESSSKDRTHTHNLKLLQRKII